MRRSTAKKPQTQPFHNTTGGVAPARLTRLQALANAAPQVARLAQVAGAGVVPRMPADAPIAQAEGSTKRRCRPGLQTRQSISMNAVPWRFFGIADLLHRWQFPPCPPPPCSPIGRPAHIPNNG